MRKVTALLAFFGLFVFMSCDKSSYTEDFQLTKTTTSGNNGGFGISPGPGATRDTVRTTVYWETHLLDAFMTMLTPDEISFVIGKHVPTSILYVYSDLHQPAQFIPITNDVDINPIWQVMTIEFNPGFAPVQFTSSAQVDSVLHVATPEIRLTDAMQYYRYAVSKHE